MRHEQSSVNFELLTVFIHELGAEREQTDGDRLQSATWPGLFSTFDNQLTKKFTTAS